MKRGHCKKTFEVGIVFLVIDTYAISTTKNTHTGAQIRIAVL